MSRAYWTIADEENLLDFLIEKRSEGGEGSFKPATWIAAAAKVNETKTRGGNKSKDSCRSKYQSVGGQLLLCFLFLNPPQLKATYEVVRAVRSNSGWSWNDEHGANIDSDLEANEGKWDDYIAKHPAAIPFRNKGWPLLARYDDLCGHNIPKGSHVFRASQTPATTLAKTVPTLSQAADSDEGEDDEPEVNHTEENPQVCFPSCLRIPDQYQFTFRQSLQLAVLLKLHLYLAANVLPALHHLQVMLNEYVKHHPPS